jgi:hypothetical protein
MSEQRSRVFVTKVSGSGISYGDPVRQRPVSAGYLEALEQAGASKSLVRALARELDRERVGK